MIVFAVVAVLVVGVISWVVAMDVSARRHHHRLRGPGDIAREMRQQRLFLRARQANWFRDSGTIKGAYSPDRNKRLGR